MKEINCEVETTVHDITIEPVKMFDPISRTKKPQISSLFKITRAEKISGKEFKNCYEVRVDKSGILWALDYENQVLKFNFFTGKCTVFHHEILNGPLGLVSSPFDRNSVLVSCQNASAVLLLDESKGTLSSIHGLSDLGRVRGLDFDSKLNLYVSIFASEKTVALLKFSCAGGLDKITKLEQQAPADGNTCTVRVNPKNDEVYTSYYDPSAIYKRVGSTVVHMFTHFDTSEEGRAPLGATNGLWIYEDLLLVADEKDDCIRVIDLKTNTVETLDVELHKVNTITVDPIAKVFYVANEKTIYRLYFESTLDKLLFAKGYPPKQPGDLLITFASLH